MLRRCTYGALAGFQLLIPLPAADAFFLQKFLPLDFFLGQLRCGKLKLPDKAKVDIHFLHPVAVDLFRGVYNKYGEVDFRDLMEFTDEVLRRYPEIDADRMGVAGGSYGGFMTNWVIGHTDRFRCAVSQRSIANYVGDYLLSDIGYYYVPDQQLGTIWEHPERLWKASPLTYADRVKTPTLFIHADKDYRCTLANGLEMFAALKLHGVESKLCMFYGENHGLSREGKPSNRISRLSEILRWMDEHLKEE